MKFEEKTKPRAQFVRFMNYIQTNLDFCKLEEEEMLEVYYDAMKFYNDICGNAKYSELYEEDIELMLSVRNKHLTTKELAEYHSLTPQAIHPKMHKLISKGYVSSYKEKKETFYKLTPYGNKLLLDKVLLK